MKLVIVHHHFRPGGVRRVIELAAPHLAHHWPGRLDGVVLASGERPPPEWLDSFRARLQRTPVELSVQPAFGYASELEPSHVTSQAASATMWRDYCTRCPKATA